MMGNYVSQGGDCDPLEFSPYENNCQGLCGNLGMDVGSAFNCDCDQYYMYLFDFQMKVGQLFTEIGDSGWDDGIQNTDLDADGNIVYGANYQDLVINMNFGQCEPGSLEEYECQSTGVGNGNCYDNTGHDYGPCSQQNATQ